jgi:nickel-dependent lactate racemase
MSSPTKPASVSKSAKKAALSAFGATGQRVLKRAFQTAKGKSGDQVVREFQQANSLHSMMATAFDTKPRYENEEAQLGKDVETTESLDTDSVLEFLSHLGVSHLQAHKRISEHLSKRLTDEIEKTTDHGSLLVLLPDVWAATVKFEQKQLSPIISSILKKLGEATPEAVLLALAERNDDGSLKNQFIALPEFLHKLVWEADWNHQILGSVSVDPKTYLEKASKTLFFQQLNPFVEQYCTNKFLVRSANTPFVNNKRDRQINTTHRRALTANSAAPPVAGSAPLHLGKGNASATTDDASSGNAIVNLRDFLKDDSPEHKLVYRPKLFHALLSILMARHGSYDETFLGGADFLHCSFLSDILLSAGGPLPNSYDDLLSLARCLDDCVQKGVITDETIKKIQTILRRIFQPDMVDEKERQTTSTDTPVESMESVISSATQRQLNHIVTGCIAEMKDVDQRQLFLKPVTDDIAPGYSRVIRRPMCIKTMEEKVEKDVYKSVDDFRLDVKLMFKNCRDYNQGEGGQWYRQEASRQEKVFEEDIFPRARDHYREDMVRRQHELVSSRKRQVEHVLALQPLPPSVKKRKKDQDDLSVSVPALASMLMADPFFVRIVSARVLRELRIDVMKGESLPAAHRAIPSLLQFLHLARLSTKVCATYGKRFAVPAVGIEAADPSDDTLIFLPFATLRNDLPLLLRLLVETELENRVIDGGDLYHAWDTSGSLLPTLIDPNQWVANEHMEVAVTLIEGAFVHICDPDNAIEASFGAVFEKFALALQHVGASLRRHRLFFKCLNHAIIRHKAKLTRPARDTIVRCWLGWLRSFGNGCAISAAHECFVMLLNDWASIGNVVLPRDKLVEFCKEAVDVVNQAETLEENKFHNLWRAGEAFSGVKKQYERMLRMLPSTVADDWKIQVGIAKDGPNARDGMKVKDGSIICAVGSPTTDLADAALRRYLYNALEQLGPRDKVLLLPPDFTRFHSQAGKITQMICQYYNFIPSSEEQGPESSTTSPSRPSIQILPALGTHAPMTEVELRRMYGDALADHPEKPFVVHDWRNDVVTIGEVPADLVAAATHGKITDRSWPAQVNKLIWAQRRELHEDQTLVPLILSIGQVVPHEVMGMANFNKNVFVGTGGTQAINLSHFIGAVHGMERMMGRAQNPLRDILNYASQHFLESQLDLCYILTVVGPKPQSDANDSEHNPLALRGLFVGRTIECYNQACSLSLKVNFSLLKQPLQKCVVYLDPDEFRSTWLGNKAIYRTRMAMADGGTLVVLAPGVERFGEDAVVDRLIRRYGYHGTPSTLRSMDESDELRDNLSAVAHMIHGSTEGRFNVVYCPGHLNQQEIEQAGFQYGDISVMLEKYNPQTLRDGWNADASTGEEFFYISNPALGLWALASRFEDRDG